MAFATDRDDSDEIADINVTPFIDVMLVLLIIFMIAAPLSTVDIPVNLPGSNAPATDRPDDPLWLTLTVDGKLVLGQADVTPQALVAALDAATGAKRDTPVFLRADQAIPYGQLMALLDRLRGGGYLKVALVGLDGAAP
jgi:biopolymer transport protein ExbD